jgi:hypothetical protein
MHATVDRTVAAVNAENHMNDSALPERVNK